MGSSDEASPREGALWLLDSLVPGTAVNHVPVAFSVAGHWDPSRLDETLTNLARRHPALRTVFVEHDGHIRKRILGADEFAVEISSVDTAHEPGVDDVLPSVTAPFGFSGTPMLRAVHVRGPASDVFCVTAHELILDRFSATAFCAELAAAVDSGVAGLPTAQLLDGRAGSAEFWRTQLAGASLDDNELGCAAGEPENPTLRGDGIEVPFTAETAAAVASSAKRLGVTEDVVLLAAFFLLLEAHGTDRDLTVGLPVDLRSAPTVLGNHVNYLPLRLTVQPQGTVRELVVAAADTLAVATQHADASVDSVSGLLPQSARRAAPFRYVFAHELAVEDTEFLIDGLHATRLYPDNGYAKFDVEFSTVREGDSLSARVRYRTELFDRETIELLAARYATVLDGFAADPDLRLSAVPVWCARDHEVIDAANDTTDTAEFTSVLGLFHDCVTTMPDAIAFIDGERQVSYRQLWHTAQRISVQLKAEGIDRGDLVALAIPRGAELAAAALGAWFAGAAYLPIDVTTPAERVNYQLTDSAAKVLLTTAEHTGLATDDIDVVLIPAIDGSANEPVPDAAPIVLDGHDTAYLIYTSGSTGRPKGTLIHHRALANLVAHFVAELRPEPGDTTVWLTTFAFDMSVPELFVPLVSHGRLAVAPDTAKSDGRTFAEFVRRYEARFIQATPTTWRLVIDRVADALAGRTTMSGGEPVPVWLAQRFLSARSEFHHLYGPTETTVWSTSAVVSTASGARLSVGKPIRNTQVFVLDEDDRCLPLGVRGELCIAGDGVAVGYHNRPELTEQRFGQRADYGRFYRTGDVACWRHDGTIDLYGRRDRQVKLRGNRIELGEIETTLQAHSDVGAAAVIMVGDPSADAVLIACLEPAAGQIATDSVAAHVRARLSSAMMPTEFVTLDSIPINANEKVDYPALQRMIAARPPARIAAVAAEDDDTLLDTLTTLWARILDRADVSADTDFFFHGGNSMLAAWAVHEVSAASGVPLTLTDIFERRTPRALVSHIQLVASQAS